MITLPPSLKKGDTIGLVCPSGYMPREKAATCIETLEEWGYRVRVGNTLGAQFHYFSGTDEERLRDLQAMLDDDSIRAILCGRGGYGMSRIIDRLNLSAFAQSPKWIIGFSDITVLHAQVVTQHQVACLHAPMAAAFNDGGNTDPYVLSLKDALEGKKTDYRAATHSLNRAGEASGMLVGGNLSILAHLVGTDSAFDMNNCILFLEDVGEYIYNIDRMLIQLKRSGVFNNLAGLIVGGFTELKDTVIPFGNDVATLISEHVAGSGFPVCFDFPVSHDKKNVALKVGVLHRLSVTAEGAHLQELNSPGG